MATIVFVFVVFVVVFVFVVVVVTGTIAIGRGRAHSVGASTRLVVGAVTTVGRGASKTDVKDWLPTAGIGRIARRIAT